jgi:hypothetical protein
MRRRADFPGVRLCVHGGVTALGLARNGCSVTPELPPRVPPAGLTAREHGPYWCGRFASCRSLPAYTGFLVHVLCALCVLLSVPLRPTSPHKPPHHPWPLQDQRVEVMIPREGPPCMLTRS